MTKFLTLALLFVLVSCQSESRKLSRDIELITPKNDVIETRLAITLPEQEQGLSGVKPEDFKDTQAMFFYYDADGDKYFWMPDTYFDLDLFYLDKDLKVIDVVRKLPHHIGRHNQDLIPRARGVWCRHVLEMKASSPLAAQIQVGDQLQLKGALKLADLEKKIKEEAGAAQ